MVAVIRSERQMKPVERAMLARVPNGPPSKRTAGGHIYDLVTLGKAIALCDLCNPKFDSSRCGYITKRNIPFVAGQCDGCGTSNPHMRLFLKGTPFIMNEV